MRHRGLRKSALSLPEGCLGAPQITSQTRCWKPPADSGRFLRHAFVLHYVQDEKGDRATKQRQAHSTCLGSGLLLPRPLSRKWLTLLLPLLQLRKGNTSLFFFFFKGPLTHDSRTPEKRVPERTPEWGHSTQEARLTDITQNESLHLRLLLVLLPPLLRVSKANGST